MSDGVSVQTKRALLESGAMTPDELSIIVKQPTTSSPTPYKGGSSAAQDAADAAGITIQQLRARQNQQLQDLLNKRKAQGYASGGKVGALNSLTPEQQQFYDTWNSIPYPQPELKVSTSEPAYQSFEDAVRDNIGIRKGLAQLIASPLMLTDISESSLDALRGVHSPNRFKQATNAISSAIGGDTDPIQRDAGPYDTAAMGAGFLNPGNFAPIGKASEVLQALTKARGLQRLASGHSLASILAKPATLREIQAGDDFYRQAAALGAAQDLRGRQLLDKGASIPDMLSDFMYNHENGGKVYEVMPSATNKRGWAMIAPPEQGKPAYISGIMAEEPGSKDFVNSTFNALLDKVGGKATATAANGALAKYYKSKGIPVDKDWNMKFASGGLIEGALGGLGRLARRLL